MRTAQDYLGSIDGLEKEAFVMGAGKLIMKGLQTNVQKVGKFTTQKPASITPSFGTQMGNNYKTAKKWSSEQYGKYKKTDIGKKYGDAPLWAAGGVATGGVVL